MMQSHIRVLIVGGGGREHAYAWKLSQSPFVDAVYVAPGNGGTTKDEAAKISNVNIKGDDYPVMVKFSLENKVNLVVPGPEAPLVDGIKGYFEAVGIRVFGPSKAAAQMEGSKVFSKEFMKRNHIPTATYEIFSDYENAKKYLDSVTYDVVVKVDGLAGGKGVLIPKTKEEAHGVLKDIMLDNQFGEAGNKIVIEELLDGNELSVVSISDGYTIRSLPPAQDHKRIFDGDQGPNTGGMGCYAPTPFASKEISEAIDRTVVRPTIDGMRKEGMPFVGFLFTGLMMTKSGPKVLEYNVRGGDPEIETLLPLLSEDTDLAQVMVACADHWLDGVKLTVQPKFSATIITVAEGYPGSYAKGRDITLNPSPALIFHAGTSRVDGQLKTSGGRVFAITATADTLEDAVKQAYEGVSGVKFQGIYYRKDIAHRAFREQPATFKDTHLTYAAAGVSIDAGNSLVQQIKSKVAQTKRPGTDAVIGGFGGTFSLAASESGFHPSSPTLIGAVDGVGTKLMIAHELGIHDTVGIDLVAMNVNDLVVQGAEPLFFLDCFSCSELDVNTAASFVSGVATGCIQSHCALIGGETAEMPGVFQGNQYDAVGAAVGAIDTNTSKILPDSMTMKPGDVLLGIASSGPHSNGYSLIRKIVARSGLPYSSPAPFSTHTAATLGQALLTPTRIYVRPLLAALSAFPTGTIKGLAHITGGGLVDNVPRMLSSTLSAHIDVASWDRPDVFRWLKDTGNVTAKEMSTAFNNGIGMVCVVESSASERVKEFLQDQGETVYIIGNLAVRNSKNDEGCLLSNLDSWER